MWKDTGVPRVNPHKHGGNVQTTQTVALAGILFLFPPINIITKLYWRKYYRYQKSMKICAYFGKVLQKILILWGSPKVENHWTRNVRRVSENFFYLFYTILHLSSKQAVEYWLACLLHLLSLESKLYLIWLQFPRVRGLCLALFLSFRANAVLFYLFLLGHFIPL